MSLAYMFLLQSFHMYKQSPEIIWMVQQDESMLQL